MVKVNDARYAKKYGVNKMPALVYFRRKFPSIYRDNLFDENTILEWLTSNRSHSQHAVQNLGYLVKAK